MLRRLLYKQSAGVWGKRDARQAGFGLQTLLWTLWTLAIAVVGYLSWHADVLAQRPINILGVVIHCVVTGVIGLVVMTVVEMRAEPWRFMDDD